MFTGIIEEIGTIKAVKNGQKSSVLTIEAKKVLEGTCIGDSIAANGVCLTVTHMDKNSYDVDVMAETLRRSNLGTLKVKDRVNLERALSLNSRLGGHIVSGHIDGTGTIERMVQEDNAIWVTIRASDNILKYVIEKGSIAIDGISLTVAYVDTCIFKVSVIPHTGKQTILLDKKIGDTVNLECDLIGKYVEKLLGYGREETTKHTISMEFLKEHGFV